MICPRFVRLNWEVPLSGRIVGGKLSVANCRSKLTLLPHDDVALGALDDCEQFVLLGFRNAKLVQRLLEQIKHDLPPALGDVEVRVGLLHAGCNCEPRDADCLR